MSSIIGLPKSSTYNKKIELQKSGSDKTATSAGKTEIRSGDGQTSSGVYVDSSKIHKQTVARLSGGGYQTSDGNALRASKYRRDQYNTEQYLNLQTSLNGELGEQGWNTDFWKNGGFQNTSFQPMSNNYAMLNQLSQENSIASMAVAGKELLNTISDVKDIFFGGDNTGKGASSDSKSVSAMQNADTESSLSAAISSAQTRQSALPDEITQKDSSVKELKGKTDGLKTSSENAKKAVDQNAADIKTTAANVKQDQSAVDSYQQSYDSLMNSANTATDEKTKADFKQKAEAVKAKLDQEKSKLTQDQSKLTELQGKTKDLQAKAANAKDDYDKNIKDIQSGEETISNMKEEQDKLKTEIPKQQARLTKLQNKDDKELAKVTKEVTDLTNDVTKLNSSGKTEKAQSKQAKLDKKKGDQAKLQKQQDIRKFPSEIIAGTEFKTGKSGGQDVYLVDGKEVSKADFDTKKKEATSGKKTDETDNGVEPKQPDNADNPKTPGKPEDALKDIPQDIRAKGDEAIREYAKDHNITLPPKDES